MFSVESCDFSMLCIKKLVIIHAVCSCAVLALVSVLLDKPDITGSWAAVIINICGSKLKSIDTGFITWYHKYIR